MMIIHMYTDLIDLKPRYYSELEKRKCLHDDKLDNNNEEQEKD